MPQTAEKLISSAGSQAAGAGWRGSQWEALLAGGYESTSQHNDSAKLGACDMTLCSDLKGQIWNSEEGRERRKKKTHLRN